ncbi:FAD-dependent monooxygenase [Embleya sp. NPDC020886]|uniref:oxidoreductase n=1 Tax=Embleya sp. NPDC020886 TaxID=3363980 RepID=UPI0037930E58
MRIAVIGGGPGGLYFAALAKQLSPAAEITLWERNAPDDVFGFGVVFSDETLDGIAQADPEVFAAMSQGFARWTDIDVRYGGSTLTSGGHGFAALGRERLLRILQDRCAALGVDLRYRTEAPDVAELACTHDLVVASDGVRSTVRERYADTFRPSLDERGCRYMWLGTDKVFDAFTFIVDKHDFGVVQVHAYPFDDRRSTFIVELAEDAWRRGGFAEFAGRDLPRGASDDAGIARCEALLAEHLDGHRLIPNNSRWIRFSTVRNATWRHENVVLLGDAAHTAHFSIGSGTKLAMEDALALAACLNEHAGIPAALTAYEAERKPVVSSTQRAAQASLEWFENIDRAVGQAPEQFAFNLLTRSRRVTHANLLERDPEFVARVDAAFTAGRPDRVDAAPMFQPFRLGSVRLRNRVVVPPMATYAAEDGIPGPFESAHLGALALGGASLVFAGMTAVLPNGRSTEACPGLWSPAHEVAWREVVTRVKEQAPDGPLLGIQIGHAGRRAASTVPDAEGRSVPLGPNGWPTVAASAIPWDAAGDFRPREADRADLDAITAAFAAAAARADRAGFDALELQYGHGHLLSGFLSPLTNLREDEYGGTLAGRLRFPIEVLAAVRAVWPTNKPLVVRISASDWAEGGTTEDDAVRIARALAAAGADAIDVSSGEVVPHERPAYGRGYQTPFADLIRNATGVPTIAVGAISTYDDVNSILLAGRADLCAVGRAHLYDPMWTLHAAAEQGYTGPGAPWPSAWRPGSRKPPGAGSDRVPPRLHLLRESVETVPRRWRPTRDSPLVAVPGRR